MVEASALEPRTLSCQRGVPRAGAAVSKTIPGRQSYFPKKVLCARARPSSAKKYRQRLGLKTGKMRGAMDRRDFLRTTSAVIAGTGLAPGLLAGNSLPAAPNAGNYWRQPLCAHRRNGRYLDSSQGTTGNGAAHGNTSPAGYAALAYRNRCQC
jgi:hypothetical protein